MLSCDICGEEMMLEEDMKTHLLLSHLENEMSCPLCSLSGVSYDELCFHISSAHSEKDCDKDSQSSTSSQVCSAGVAKRSRTEPRCSNGVFCHDGDADSSCVNSDSTLSAAAGSSSSITNKPPSPGECNTTSTHQQKEWPSRPDGQFSCPMCPLVCSTAPVLEEHVELHLQEQSSANGGRNLECPVCSAVFDNSTALQEHVELHLDTSLVTNDDEGSERGPQSEEEQQQRRELLAKQEREDFQKLQSQYGLDGSGGYRRQMERWMERAVARGQMDPAQFHSSRAQMMESLATGLDDGKTRTPGVMKALCQHYQQGARECTQVWLCADTEHFCSSPGDKGWGCGYRNTQMLLSALRQMEAFAPLIPESGVPSIPRLQSLMEAAWAEGLDPHGASHFHGRLRGTRAWIGATEIYSLLTSLSISAQIVDFHQPTGPADTHPRLFQWVKLYFSQACRDGRVPPRVFQTARPPLYLQHQGHSRSIVGVEQRRNGTLCLLILDPGCSPSDARKLLSQDTVGAAVRQMRKFPRNLTHKQYQVVAVQGVLSPQDKQVCIVKSRALCAERIP